MKSLTHFFSFLAVMGALASGAFYYLNSLENDRVEADLQVTQGMLVSEQSKSQKLSQQVEALQSQLTQADANLQEARANITVATARANQLKRENTRLSEELDQSLSSEETLQRQLSDLKKEMAAQQAESISPEEAARYEQTIATLESELIALKTAARNASATLPQNTAKPAPDNLEGKILTVGPQSSFVITNLGYTSGIRLDHLLAIEREGRTIARLQVTDVKENLSIARILPESFITEPNSGDRVVSGSP